MVLKSFTNAGKNSRSKFYSHLNLISKNYSKTQLIFKEPNSQKQK